MKLVLLFLLLFGFITPVFSQKIDCFCKAVEKQIFKKVARIFNRELKKRKNGTTFDNGPESGMQITHQYNLDTITLWLKKNRVY